MKNKKVLFIAQAGIIAALYAALTLGQGALFPGTTTAAVQFRVSEALNILALFTPAAIPGLTLGCVISNLQSIGQGLPLDMIFGSLATLGSSVCMYFLRNAVLTCYVSKRGNEPKGFFKAIAIREYPLFAMLMPALWNGVIVGWEIEFFFEHPDNFSLKSFAVLGGYVAIGELAVMLLLGSALYIALTKRKLDKKLF